MQKETVEVKKYLSQVRRQRDAIRAVKRKIGEIESSLYGTKAIRYDTVRVQSTAENMLEAKEAEIDEITRNLKKLISEYEASCARIIGQITALDCTLFSRLLICRYIDGKSWMRTAEEIHISEDYARHIHGRALVAFREKFGDAIEKVDTK